MHRNHITHPTEWAPDPYSPHTGDFRFHVVHYDLELACKLGGNRLDGTATLTIQAGPGVDQAELDLVGLAVNRVNVNGRKVTFKHRQSRLSFPLPPHPGADEVIIVEVRYGGNPGPRLGPWGDVGWEELEDGVLVAGQPDGASTWFPCNDTPGDKSTYRVRLTTDAGYRPVMPGELVSRRRTASRETWEFREDAPTAAYLETLQIGRYEPYQLPSGAEGQTPLTVYCTPEVRQRAFAALKHTDRMVSTFEQAFGPYPFESYGCVVTVDNLEIPLEAQGLSVFGDNHLSTSWEAQRLIAHELSHQWFGNSVTVRTWQDLWMHEGFACYSEWLWSEAVGAKPLMERAWQAWAGLRAAGEDITIGHPGPQDMFDDRVYKRGALTVLALRQAMGQERFTEMMHAWTGEHRFGTVTRAAFEDHLRRFSAPGTELAAVLVPWLDQEALPDFPV